jgi:tetratricopeptide (TPR) repeat protein
MPVFYYIAPFILLAITISIIIFLRRKRVIVFGLLFLLVNLLLILQLVSVGNAIMADRYTYVPYIGVFLLLGYGSSYLLRSQKKKIKKWGTPALLLLLLFSGTMAYATYERNKVWKDSETLWTDVIEKYPGNSIGWYNRGEYLSNREQYEKAIPDYTHALLLRPNYYEALYNRAQGYRLSGQNELAIADYRNAISVRPREPKPQLNIGLAYFNLKEYAKALEEYNKAVQKFPEDFEAWYGRANAHFYLKEYKPAIADYSRSLELNPKYSDAWYNRAVAYGNIPDKKNAMNDLLKAQELGHPPDTVLMNWLKK